MRDLWMHALSRHLQCRSVAGPASKSGFAGLPSLVSDSIVITSDSIIERTSWTVFLACRLLGIRLLGGFLAP